METNTQKEEKAVLEWSAPIGVDHERGRYWYYTAAVVLVLLVLYGIIWSWTFLLVVLLASGLYWRTHREKLPLRTIRITEKGVFWEKEFFSWSALNGFWILQGPHYFELHIEPKNVWRSELLIQLGEQKEEEVEAMLKRFLTEFPDRKERLLDTIIRICKL